MTPGSPRRFAPRDDETATAGEERREKGFFCPRGQPNPLKRLISDKEIQGKPSLFLCWILLGVGRAFLDLAKFGIGLEKRGSGSNVHGRYGDARGAAGGGGRLYLRQFRQRSSRSPPMHRPARH